MQVSSDLIFSDLELIPFLQRIAADSRVDPSHVSMYVALCLASGSTSTSLEFNITRRRIMEHSRIGSIVTYHKKIKELKAWGYIEYIPSCHPKKGGKIVLLPKKSAIMPASVITPDDLQTFKKELLEDIKKLVSQRNDISDRKWLKSHEVRKLLALSPGTLQHLRIKGILPFTKIGGIIYYNYDDIKKMLEGSKTR